MFSHLKVVELASVLAGPAAGMFFAELGAQVIKVENKKTGGDVTRNWKNKNEEASSPLSAYFASVNWGKEHITLDYTDATDLQKTKEILKTADIVIANFKPGDAKKFGLDYTSLKKENPGIIYGNITGFGTNDHRVAYDVVLQAESGFMSMNGTSESGPVKMPVALIDVLAAHQLKEALLLALLKKEKTGKGSYCEVSLFDSAVCSLVNQASNFLMSGMIPKPAGSLHPNIAPYGETFFTSDNRQIVLAIGSEDQFRHFAEQTGLQEKLLQPEFSSNALRVKNRSVLALLIAPAIKQMSCDEFMQKMKSKNIPCGVIKSLDEVFADEKTKSLVMEETINGILTKRVKTVAFKKDFLND
ncbi:MAG: CaiB/BaiF CoA transferase family protein [Bacteroidota bacterium]